MLSAVGVQAADTKKSVEELQAEVERLTQELEASKKREQDLISKGVAATPDDTAPAAAGEAPVEAVAETEAEPEPEQEETKDLGEVVVRRTRAVKYAKLKDVPSSSSIVTAKDLAREQTLDLGGITKRAANVSRNTGNSRTYGLSIRGVGRVGIAEASDPSVNTIIDGVSSGYNGLASFDFYDVEDVQVLRGPQGTQGGKNSVLGAVSIRNRRPTFTPETNWGLSYGEWNRVVGDVAAGGAVIDDLLAWRGSLHVDKGDGWVINEYNHDQTWHNRDRVSGRLQALLTPTDNFSALVKVEAQPRGAEFYNGLTFRTPTPNRWADGSVNPLRTDASTRLARRWFTEGIRNYSYEGDYLAEKINLNAQQPLITYTTGANVQLDWQLGDFHLASITGFNDYHFNARNDEGTPFDISLNGGGKVDRYEQISQEFRVSSKYSDLVDYTAGLWYMQNRHDFGQGINSNNGWGADAGAWFANPTQYAALDVDGNGRYLMENSLKGMERGVSQNIVNRSSAIFGQANWHVTDPFTITTGLRFTNEWRRNSGHQLLQKQGFGPELNPVEVNGVKLGGFATNAVNADNNEAGISGELTAAALADPNQVAVANSVAQKYFGKNTYAELSATEKRQVGHAQAIRRGQIGVLWHETIAEPFKANQPSFVLSPSYKINDQMTTYFSYQYGEKAGISQLVNGVSNLARPEKNNSIELGLKTELFDRTLSFNTDVFLSYIKDYQQEVSVLDSYTTNLLDDGNLYYTTANGNAAEVRVIGVEIDGQYSGIPYTTINFSGAFNDAIYTDFKNAAQPVENGFTGAAPYRDVTGQRLAGAAQFTFNIAPEVRVPVSVLGGENVFHTSFNTYFTSKYNSDVNLSSYAWIPANTTTDFAIGMGRRDNLFDLNLVVKNLFNNQTPQSITWNSFVPSEPRWFGVVVSGKL